MVDQRRDTLTALASEEEWRVLLSLAQAPSPAQACRALNWCEELFSTPETLATLGHLQQAQRPISLTLSPALDGLIPYREEELPGVRQRMACAVLCMRLLPDYQRNLRERLLAMLEARLPGEGELSERFTSMLEATLAGMDTSLETLKRILSSCLPERMSVATQGELDAHYWERIQAMKAAAPTGFPSLNRMLSGGLHPERFMVILGAPGAGKTTFANQIAEYVASKGRPVVYLACEESAATLYAKTLARLGGVEYAAVQFGWASARDQIDAARAKARERLSTQRLLYIEGFSGLAELRDSVKGHVQRYSEEQQGGGPGLLVVDYLQCLAQILARGDSARGGMSENQLISLLCYDLRALAKECTCTVMAISRQNRASGYGNSNALTSGSGSGGIEYGADVVMSIDKDEDRTAPPGWKGRVVAVPKNRLGEADTRLLLDWRGNRQEFRETNRGEDDDA